MNQYVRHFDDYLPEEAKIIDQGLEATLKPHSSLDRGSGSLAQAAAVKAKAMSSTPIVFIRVILYQLPKSKLLNWSYQETYT